jgi:large subunit ribosomal protein L19
MKANALTKETIMNYGVTDRGFPDFRVGDTIEVSQIIKEGEKERIQLFEGDVVTFSRKGITSTFLVRRIGANGVGVERIFPYHAKTIDSIRLVRHGKVRRANLKYLRDRLGKSARLKEKFVKKEAA